jgi:tetratricopeptide (TPR) repeat protein
MRLALLLAAVASTAAACARPVPVVAPDPRDEARLLAVHAADARAAEGCYLPLSEALTGYEQALAVHEDEEVRSRAFDTAVLLALRERALGLYPGRYQEAPGRLAAGLPPARTTAALDVLALAPWRRGTLPPASPGAFDGVRRRATAARQALDPHLASDVVAATLYVTLVTNHPYAVQPADTSQPTTRVEPLTLESAPWAAAHLDHPAFAFPWLLAQRTTTVDDWQAWHASRPRCVEALVPQGDLHVALRRLASADRLLGVALEALPDLVPARAMRGEIRAQLADYDTALALFREVRARVPNHREASLGEVEALSTLRRHTEALAAAEAMLADSVGYPGDAHYWRAWNLFQLGRIGHARAALDQARRLIGNADVHYLGGVIAYREEQWEEARDELRQAIAMDETHCDAHFTRASVALLQQAWPAASVEFAGAADCFRMRVPALEAAVAEVEGADLPEALREGLRARRVAALEANHRQERWAFYNQAVALANTGEGTRARRLAEDVATGGGDPGAAARDLLVQLSRQER